MNADLGERFIQWAAKDDSVKVLAQIGSRIRPPDSPAAPDAASDWDFQLITTNVRAFETRADFEVIGLGSPRAFVSRPGRLGSARKVTALFDDGELDVVVIPFEQMAGVTSQLGAGTGGDTPFARRALGDMALVLLGGYRIIKDLVGATRLYQTIATSVPVPCLGDAGAIEAAEGFVCDYFATRRLAQRGERAAAQRWLHHQLVETNLRLLHELRRRQGRTSYPDARRLEQVDDGEWVTAVSVGPIRDEASLLAAIEQAAAACRGLMQALVGPAWTWPVLQASRTPA